MNDWVPQDPYDMERFKVPTACRAFIADVVLLRTETGKRDTPFGVGTSLALQFRLLSVHCKYK